MSNRSYVLATVLIVLFCDASPAVNLYHFTPLPFQADLHDVTFNANGQYLAELLGSQPLLFHPILKQGSINLDLGFGPNNTDNAARSINSTGQIAGYVGDYGALYGEPNNPFVNRAYLWSPDVPNGTTGSRVNLGLLPGPGEVGSSALGINDRGQVVGFGSSLFGDRAFLWSPTTPNGTTGSMVVLGDIPGGIGVNRAIDINSTGQVVGRAVTATGTRAFLWTPSSPNGTTGAMIDLGELPGGADYSQAFAVNSQGQVVGLSQTELGFSAFIWSPTSPNGNNGTLIDIGESLGALYSEARDINSFGQVVGRAHMNGSSNDLAYTWIPHQPNGTSGAVFDLNMLIDDPIVKNHWILREARAINDLGEIVGVGEYYPNGYVADPHSIDLYLRAFVLTPGAPLPEPTATTLAVVGIVLLGSCRFLRTIRIFTIRRSLGFDVPSCEDASSLNPLYKKTATDPNWMMAD